MRRKIVKACFFIIFVLVLLPGCNFAEHSQQDLFYQNGGEFDHLRFPLIKPYYAIYATEKYGWQIPLQGDPSERDFYYYITLQDAQDIAVENGVIMVYTSYEQPVDERVGQKKLYWFVLVPDQKTEMGFDNENDFLSYVQQYGIQQPPWRTPDNILKEFDETRCLDWIPNCP